MSRSSKPFADHHLIYAVVLTALAAGAGATLGFGELWATLPIVRDHNWPR